MYKIVKITPSFTYAEIFISFPSPDGESLNPTSNKNNMNGAYFSEVGFKSGISVYLVLLMDSILAYSQIHTVSCISVSQGRN